MTTRRALAATLVAAIAVGAVMAGLVVGGVFGRGTTRKPPSAQAGKAAPHQTMDALATIDFAAARVYTPPPTQTMIPTPKSCPIDPRAYCVGITQPKYELAVGRFPAIFGTPGKWRLTLLSQAAGFTEKGAPYQILSGSLNADLQQGVLIVWLSAKDPCVEGRQDYPPVEYDTPFRAGPAALTQLDGETVLFRTGDGTTGRLNFVTGNFE